MSCRDVVRRHLAPLLPAFVLLAGCAAATQTARPDTGGVGVRVPAAESFDFTRRAAPAYPPAPAPFFEDDEYRYSGRWLTLFEVEYSLQEPPPKPPATER